MPRIDAADEMLRIEPPPALAISGIAYLHDQTTALSDTSMIESHASFSSSVTRRSLLPGTHQLGGRGVVHERRELAVVLGRRAHHRDHVVFLRHVGAHVGGVAPGVADLLFDLVARVLGPTGDDHLGALAREADGDGTPDPTCRAGDDRNLVCHAHGRTLAHSAVSATRPVALISWSRRERCSRSPTC